MLYVICYTIVTNYRMGLYCAQRDPGAVVEEDRHYTLIYIFNMFPNSFDFSPWHIIEQDPPFALFYNKERYRSEAGSKAAEMLEIWLTGGGEIKQNIERGDRWWSGPTCIRAVTWTSRNITVPREVLAGQRSVKPAVGYDLCWQVSATSNYCF